MWLDPANPYGSIPNKLVEVTITKPHICNTILHLILAYYNQVSKRVSDSGLTSEWDRAASSL